MYLHTKNKEVENYNNRKITKVGQLITLVKAKNTGGAKLMNNNNFGGLMLNIHVYIG